MTNPNKRRSQFEGMVHACALDQKTTHKAAAAMLRRGMKGIERELAATGRFSFPGFGTWRVTRRKARRIRNPVTHDLMQIEATLSVRFRPARQLLQRLHKLGWR